MNLAIVEDEPRVRSFLENSLKKDGYDTFAIGSLQALQDFIEAPTFNVDIWVMDRMLHASDTMKLIPVLRKKFPHSKILILSALSSPVEKAEALDFGADDYLSKPFSLQELAARLRALSRRDSSMPNNGTNNQRMQLGNLVLDLVAHEARVAEKRVDLSGKELDVLRCLLLKPGQVLNRFQLLDRVWSVQFDVESNVVEVTIKNLRKKLSEAGASCEIANRRGLGYWIEANSP